MIFLFDVDFPDVVGRAIHDVLHGQHRGVHRVVLIVVAMHAVTANWVNIGCAIVEPLAQTLHIGFVTLVVERVGLRHTHDISSFNLAWFDEADCFEFASGEGNELLVVGVPKFVALEHEVLESKTGATLFDHVRRPRTKILNAANNDGRRMDVDPVVGEARTLRNNKCHGEEVAVAKIVRGGEHIGGRWRIHRFEERGHRHRGNDLVAGERGIAVGTLGRH